MKRIGVFGGTFNPPHIGHLIIAEQARSQVSLDRVMWVPAFVSPHKTDADQASPAHRLAMVSLATAGNLSFLPSEMECARKGVSYTIDTLTRLKETHPESEIHLIIGGDSLRSFGTWRDPEGILACARLIVYRRKSDDLLHCEERFLRDAIILDAPVLDISSTDIRRSIGEGRSTRYLLPERVHSFVNAHGLYR